MIILFIYLFLNVNQWNLETASLGLPQFSWTCPNCLYIFHISEAFFPPIQTRPNVCMNQVILQNLESETVDSEKCQQMVCACTGCLPVGSEKGLFHKKPFLLLIKPEGFIFKGINAFHSKQQNCVFPTVATSVSTELHQHQTLPAGRGFSPPFCPSPQFCMWYCDRWTDVTCKSAINNINLALIVVLCNAHRGNWAHALL